MKVEEEKPERIRRCTRSLRYNVNVFRAQDPKIVSSSGVFIRDSFYK